MTVKVISLAEALAGGERAIAADDSTIVLIDASETGATTLRDVIEHARAQTYTYQLEPVFIEPAALVERVESTIFHPRKKPIGKKPPSFYAPPPISREALARQTKRVFESRRRAGTPVTWREARALAKQGK